MSDENTADAARNCAKLMELSYEKYIERPGLDRVPAATLKALQRDPSAEEELLDRNEVPKHLLLRVHRPISKTTTWVRTKDLETRLVDAHRKYIAMALNKLIDEGKPIVRRYKDDAYEYLWIGDGDGEAER